ncbi:hypothetical protein V8G54_027230 [Vigna mungo]|uniref:non-specific serine/threonine protein kinase n=1 Tax=Vigna mungo TaxID=3915 RepID=A0AAQ3N2G7_VIGMU
MTMEKDTQARLEAIEITMEGMKADFAAVRRDLQQIRKALEKQAQHSEGSSDDRLCEKLEVEEAVIGEKNRDPGGGGWSYRHLTARSLSKVAGDEEKVEIAYVSRGECDILVYVLERKGKKPFVGRFEGDNDQPFQWRDGTVEEFVCNFKVVMGQTRGVPEEQVLGYFLPGLREDVKGQVRIQNPPDLMEAMRIARDVEDTMMRVQGGKSCGIGAQSNHDGTTGENGKYRIGEKGRSRDACKMRKMVRNLPYQEFLKRKEEGRCFWCGGPFTPGHRCTERSLRVLLLAKDEEGDASEEVVVQEGKLMELSACSAEGLTTPRTLKLRGKIGEKEVVVVIDSGASHNYISRRVTAEMKLPVIDIPPYLVSLGDGHKRRIRGRCGKVRVQLAEAMVEEDFYVFKLGEVNVILGDAWLEKLGEARINCAEMTMVYSSGGKKIKIRGDPALSRQLVEPKTLLKKVDAESWAIVWELGQVEKQVENEWQVELTGEQKAELQVVLQVHYHVFQEKQGLLPLRDMQHRIPLKDAAMLYLASYIQQLVFLPLFSLPNKWKLHNQASLLEIILINERSLNSLGKRVFDVYIQGNLVLKDFDIQGEAGGTGKPIVKTFNATVTQHTLKIHFYWAGKGTTSIPTRGVYGPIVSAVSVSPNFNPPSRKDNSRTDDILVIGIVAGVLVLLLLRLVFMRWIGWLGGKDPTGLFTPRQIKVATKNFDATNKTGEGGFGCVYKGLLSDVKILERRQIEQGEDIVHQLLVEWQEGGRDGATWKDSLLNLGDKVVEEGGNDRRLRELLFLLGEVRLPY